MTTPLIYSGPPIYGHSHQWPPLLYTVVPLYTATLTSGHPSYIQWSPYIWPLSPAATPLIYSGPPIYGHSHQWPPLLYTVVPLYTAPLTNDHPSYKQWSPYIRPPSPVATPLIYSGPPIYGHSHQWPPLLYTVVPLYTATLTSDHPSYIQWSPYIRPLSPVTTPLIYSGPPIYGHSHQWPPLLYTVVPLYTDPLTNDHPSYIQWSPYIRPLSPVTTPLIYSSPPIYGHPHQWPPLLYTVVPLYTATLTSGHPSHAAAILRTNTL